MQIEINNNMYTSKTNSSEVAEHFIIYFTKITTY